jgi:hypothetical protein
MRKSPRSSSRSKTSTGIKIPGRKRSAVLKDFGKISGPLRGQNRDQKPKA